MANVYEMVTARIIEELEKGIIPWQKPWTGTPDGAFSRSTGKPYSFINQLLLGKPGEYLTFNQIQEAGGRVKKGEKASIVVFWKQSSVKETNADGEEVTKYIPILRYYNVFHIDQCEGVKAKYERPTTTDHTPIENAENIIKAYIGRETVTLENIEQNRAYYSPSQDKVVLPLLTQFFEKEEYYSTAFHELTHSTMHPDRCNRQEERKGKLVAFGSEEYSKEELIAEIGAASLVNICGIESKKSFRNSAAYIQSWLSALKNDSRLIVSAASKAEKAVNYILGTEQ